MAITESDIVKALSTVQEPDLKKDFDYSQYGERYKG